MGQRLNLEIVSNERTLANAYYHWSAYTGTAFMLTTQALDAYNIYANQYEDPVELAILMLEYTGAGVDQLERQRITDDPQLSKYRIQDARNRDTGILAITDTGIAETEHWEEERVTINIEEKTVCFGVYFEETLEEWKEWNNDNDRYERYPVIDYNIEKMSFDDFYKFMTVYELSWYVNGYRKPDGSVISWIE